MHSRRGFALFLLGTLVSRGVSAQPATPHAGLYTTDPGDFLFTKFGHAALCVVSEEWPQGLCFNYGTTDFSRPVGLTVDVLRGRAEFFVSLSTLEELVAHARYGDRTLYRQTLPLTEEQLAALGRRLHHDSLPENRNYRYDHFFDNCATKPRDLIDEATGGALRGWRPSENPTFRQLANQGLSFHWGVLMASDLFLGRVLDRQTTPYESMFLPAVLRQGVAEQLGADPVVLYTRQAPLRAVDVAAARRVTWFLWGGAALLLVAGMLRAATVHNLFRTIAANLLGVMGVLMFVLMIVSPEDEIRYNELLLVFLPTDFLLAPKNVRLARGYTSVRLAMLLAVALAALTRVFVQPLWPFWTAALLMILATRLRAPELRPSA